MNRLQHSIGAVGLLALGLSWGCQQASETLDLDGSGSLAQGSQALQTQPGVCADTPKLDLKVRQVSNTNSALKYRAQVFNYGSQPVALKDLEIRIWLSDSSTSLVLDKFFGGNVYSGTNGWLFGASQLAGSTTKLTTTCHDPNREANWKIAVSNPDTRQLPANGGKWVDANFGVHKGANWANFDNLSDDYTQLPAYQSGNTADKTFNPNDPSTIYGDDLRFALYYKGVPVNEWVSTTTSDSKSGQEPSCFRTCLHTEDGFHPRLTGDPLDATLAAMVDSPAYADSCLAGSCVPMRKVNGQNEVIALITTTGSATSVRSLLTKVIYELPQIARIAGYIRVSDLSLLRAHPNVLQAESDVYLQPTMDTARVSDHADQVESVLHMSGQGTIVGVVDSGIDWRHQDFQAPIGKSIVYSLWDQNLTKQGAEQDPNDRFGYSDLASGVMYSTAEINAAIAASNSTTLVRSVDDTSGHGTCVASAAAGTGLGSGKRGIAAGADLFVVRTVRGSSHAAADSVAATKLIFNEAKRLGKPVVVNYSGGTAFGPHHGFDTAVKDLTAVQSSYDHGIIVKSAGNEANKDTHVSGTIAPNTQETTTFTTTYSDPSQLTGLYLISTFAAGATYSGIRLRCSAYQNGNADLLPTGRPIFVRSDWGVFSTPASALPNLSVSAATDIQPWGGQWAYFRIDITVAGLPAIVPPATTNTITWALTVDTQSYTPPGASSPVTQSSGGAYDIWLKEVSSSSDRIAKFTSMTNGSVNDASSVVSDASSLDFIVVGATDENTNLIAPASGRGPMIGNSGVLVDLVAPGYDTGPNAGLLMAVANPPTGPVSNGIVNGQGTSFAAPQVAGAIAMMYQKNSNLTRQQVSDILHSTADSSGLTGLPDQTYGYGRLNAFAAVKTVPPKPVTPVSGPLALAGSPPGRYDFPDVAVDANDNSILAWSADLDGNGADELYYKKVGSSGSVIINDTLLVPAQTPPDFPYFFPSVAVNSKGEYAIAWTIAEGTSASSGSRVRASVFHADGSLITPSPIEVTSPASDYNLSSDLAFIDDDHVMFLWVHKVRPAPTAGDPNPNPVASPAQLRVYEISTQSWTTTAISLSGNPGYSPHAASVDGNTVIVWSEDYNGDTDQDIVMKRFPGLTGPLQGTVTPVSDVPNLPHFSRKGGTVGLNKFGRVAATWTATYPGKGGTYAIYMKEFDANDAQLNSWSKITPNRSADITVKENGDVVLVYIENDEPNPYNYLRYVRFDNDGTKAEGTLSTRGNNDAYIQHLAISGRGNGNVSIVWSDFTAGSSNSTIQGMFVNF